MEEEHRRMGTVEHIRAQRIEIKEKMRILNQEIEQFAVGTLLLSRLPLSLKYARRT